VIKLTVNEKEVTVNAPPDKPLLWVLREDLGLTGTKFGCGVAQCRACTVHADGIAVPSCQMPVGNVAPAKITTIEGLGGDHPLQKVWIEQNVPQCGYCQSGMIMAAHALLRSNPDPSDADIDGALQNICRCGTYTRVRKAIHSAARSINGGGTR